jgi:hypothetical protein
VRKRAGSSEDRLDIAISEVLSDTTHDMGGPADGAGLEKDGVERDLQEALAAAPSWCGEGFRLVRREWPTDIGPVDLMCRIRRRLGRGGDQARRHDRRRRAAHALSRPYPARPRARRCRGVLAAGQVKPQARVLAEARGSRASRSTSPCCEASASPTCGSSPPDRMASLRARGVARVVAHDRASSPLRDVDALHARLAQGVPARRFRPPAPLRRAVRVARGNVAGRPCHRLAPRSTPAPAATSSTSTAAASSTRSRPGTGSS